MIESVPVGTQSTSRVMSTAMSPPSVADVEDRGIANKLSHTSPLLASFVDNGMVVPPPQTTAAPPTDGVEHHVGVTDDRSSFCSSAEDRDRLSAPPALVQSPSVSAMSASNYLKDQIISFFQVSDNKLAMKLFGNKNALMREKMRQRAVGNWVIHPCSNFRQVFHRPLTRL